MTAAITTVKSRWGDAGLAAPFAALPVNALTALAMSILPTAPAGTRRNRRNASAGRAISKPPARAPKVPRPRLLKSACMVRLRGKPPKPFADDSAPP